MQRVFVLLPGQGLASFLQPRAFAPSLRSRSTVSSAPLKAAVAFDPFSPGVPTTADCIPLEPPYSLSSLVTPAAPLPEPTLRKLHQLACLPYPSSVTAASLQDLVGVVDGIRSERVRTLLEAGGADQWTEDDLGWAKKEIVFDGAQELKPDDAAAGLNDETQGRELLKDAKQTVGGVYYTVKSPVT